MILDYSEQFCTLTKILHFFNMNLLQNPSIELFGLRIDEPVTALTDLIVAAVGFIGYFKTLSSQNSKPISFYRYFFLFTAISTLVAAIIGHAFTYHFGIEKRIIGWVIGIIGVAFAQFAVLYNTRQTIGEKIFTGLFYFNIFELVLVVMMLNIYRSFFIVEIYSAFGLVFMVTILEAIHYSKTKSQLSKYMMYGVALAIAAVLCHVTKLSLGIWLNHLDLSHIFMAIGLYVMYKGIVSEQKLNIVIV